MQSEDPELLRQCHLSGQMSAAQSVAEFGGIPHPGVPYTRSNRSGKDQAWVTFNIRAEHADEAERRLNAKHVPEAICPST